MLSVVAERFHCGRGAHGDDLTPKERQTSDDLPVQQLVEPYFGQ